MDAEPFDMEALADELHELVPGFSGLHAIEITGAGLFGQIVMDALS